jgi:hypothetical protein
LRGALHPHGWHPGRLLSGVRPTDDQAFAHELMNQIDGAHLLGRFATGIEPDGEHIAGCAGGH